MMWPVVVVVLVVLVIYLLNTARNKKGRVDRLPYVARETLITEAERSFFGVLELLAGREYRIMAMVRLADVVEVEPALSPSERKRALNRIDKKHIDFVLCEKSTLKVRCLIELDDATHRKKHRKERDQFLESVCQTAGIPLARIKVSASYSKAKVLEQINGVSPGLLAHIKVSQERSTLGAPSAPTSIDTKTMQVSNSPSVGQPKCQKCGSMMTMRKWKQGPHAGDHFWGCGNYPSCRQTLPLVFSQA